MTEAHPSTESQLTQETLDSYREIAGYGQHLGIGGKLLLQLVNEIERLRLENAGYRELLRHE